MLNKFNIFFLTGVLVSRFVSAEHSACRVYLGPSSLTTDEDPKLGLYAGVDYDEGDQVGNPDIGIPIVDFRENFDRPNEVSKAIVAFLEAFFWSGDYGGAQQEGNRTTTLAIPGCGALANYHAGTHNVDWVQGSALLHDGGDLFPSGKSHPARGAISPYFNFTMRAVKPIKKGMELFANFGELWDKETKDIYGDTLKRVDYEEADKVLEKILDFMEKYESQMTPQTKDDVLDFILGKILGTAAGRRAKAVRSLIPAHPGKLQAVRDMGGTFAYRNPDLVKTQKWLDKHAACVDNLEPKASTIPEAGRGAFAKRELKQGQLIAPVPLLHIGDSDVMYMFDIVSKHSDTDQESFEIDHDNPRGEQLILNYCFSHPESSMLLFPVSPMINLINHGNSEKANARLSWSKHKYYGTTFDAHDMVPSELAKYRYISLVLELTALRNIAPGEEILIDYGSEWEKAWNEHMASFKETDWPLRAQDLKVEYKTKPYLLEAELDENPYPPGVATACFATVIEAEDGTRKANDDGVEIARFAGPADFANFTGGDRYICQIIDRRESDNFFNYTVITEKGGESINQIENVPHWAITFVNLPYTSDIHYPKSFRHPIGVPDVIYPQAWRDNRD